MELLLFTKQTRLSMDNGLMEEVKAWPEEKKAKELAYMLDTIQSSWEFVDYVFSIEGVSRAFTHQFVRTRQGSYAQQSQRTVNMGEYDYIYTGASLENKEVAKQYAMVNDNIQASYNYLTTELKEPPQDARGILPTNISTNIIAKFNLRTISDMAKLRLCTRTQGEYQNIFREMRKAIIAVHPWTDKFIRVACARDGVCCFPQYKECPIKPPIFNPETGRRYDGTDNRPATKAEIQLAWENTRFEARPVEMKKEQN